MPVSYENTKWGLQVLLQDLEIIKKAEAAIPLEGKREVNKKKEFKPLSLCLDAI